VTFKVADRDESTRLTEELSGSLVSTDQTEWAKTALMRDPHGAELKLSQSTRRD